MNCYVVNPKKYYEIPDGIDKENTLFFPESKMTTLEKHTTSRPADFHIITDAPELVGLYDRKEVFIWRNNNWEQPDFQTYGTSLSIIIDGLFGIKHSIPAAVISHEYVTNCMGHPINK